MQSKHVLSALGIAAVVAPLQLVAAHAAEVPKEIIAVQIRKQGYECRNPKSAHRDGTSKLDDSIWVLACDGVSYRVTLVPNMAAKVERLSEDTTKPADKGAPKAR